MKLSTFSFGSSFWSSAAPIVCLILAGCGKSPSSPSGGEKDGAKQESKAEKDFVKLSDKPSPDEKRYLQAGKPFVLALVKQDYGAVYGLLSSHAKARMSLNQFVASTDDAEIARNEQNPHTDVSPEQFTELMKKVTDFYGSPIKPDHLSLYSSEPKVLMRQTEGMDKLDTMFAIGMMPDTVPMDIRRASLRGQINTRLSPEQLQEEAKRTGITVEDLQKDPDFRPYFTIKIVLVEEENQLRVGYFEFLPPSMMD